MTTNPDGAFMAQVARNLTDSIDGFLRGKKKLVIDRDTKFTETFRKTLAGAGVETVLTAVRAPNMNAVAERFVKTIKDECLSKMVFFVEGMLRRAIAEFVEHYHTERNHQGLGNQLLRPGPTLPVTEGTMHRQARLSGLLSDYHRRRRRAAG
ncbi:MAG: integrase core domain-containing protein [Planctomycetota bacterium]